MKTVSLFLILALSVSIVFAADDTDIHYGAFKRDLERLKSERAKSSVSYGRNAIKVTCTVLPQRRFIALAWEIDNPNKRAIDIKPDDIRLSDQFREFKNMAPVEAGGLLYGTGPDTVWEAPPSPFVNINTPATALEPPLKKESRGERDIIDSAFDFIKTDSTLITGLTYYDLYGKNERLSAEITLNGETLKFQFERE